MSCAKIRYRTEVDAMLALASTSRAADRRGDIKRAESRHYRCPRCKGWHLTSKPLREVAS